MAAGPSTPSPPSIRPARSDLISLPDHKVVRVLNDNAALKAKVAPILAGRTEMVHIPVGHGTTIDGWLIRPAQVRPVEEISDHRQRLWRAGRVNRER